MKRITAIFIILAFCLAVMAGCGSQESTAEKREIAAPGESSQTDEDTDNEQPVSVAVEGTIASLDEIKEKAVSMGYEISELMDMQKGMSKGMVNGFNIIMGSTYTPVMEFATAEEAQSMADAVNEAGYNIAIVNGRFLTTVSATKGVVENEQDQAQLESIMGARAQVQEQWTDVADVSAETSEYSGAYALADNISKDMNTLMDQALTKNNREHPEGDPKNADDVVPFMFISIPFSYTAYFGEDETMYEGIVSMAEMMGISEAKVTRTAQHNYTLTGKTFRENLPYEINGVYDSANGSIRMTEKEGGKVIEFLEFVPLGNEKYALQSSKERAVVLYGGGKIESFIYTETNADDVYSAEGDSIFPEGPASEDGWADGRAEEEYRQHYEYNGGTIKLNYQAFDKRVELEIPR